jgi:hypothetical protein
MKSRNILAASACALAFAGFANAATTVYITGSTAFRSQTITGIFTLLGSANASSSSPTLPSGGGYIFDNSATDVHKANAATIVGTSTASGDAVIVKCSWSGSGAGVQTVANTDTSKFKVNFLPGSPTYVIKTDGTGGNTDANSVAVLDPRSGVNAHEAATAQIALSDIFQDSTPFVGTFLNNDYANLSANTKSVGIVQFQWVKSKGASASITNMTPQLARALFALGKLPLSFWSGNSADENTFVYATGRDPDSGTRGTAFAEGGIGVSASVQQYDCATEALYAAQTINGVPLGQGQGGEASGGTLGSTTKMGKSGLTKMYVSYMGTGDAASLVTNGGATLTWNGEDYSDAKIKEGKYTFWGYEHLMWRSGLGTVETTFANDLVTTIAGLPSTLKLSDMKAFRSADGSVITN